MMPLSGNKTFRVIGIMSGTSLDGLDIAAVEFERKHGKWMFDIKSATTVSYSNEWDQVLNSAPQLSEKALNDLDRRYGKYIGEQAAGFLHNQDFAPDLIASHGHTVFHQPEKGYTLQIGLGKEIAVQTGTITVADFRSQDVALGGQGAPLVPVGDRLLFAGYDYCLNLGGFANISFEQKGQRLAFDICPVNIILNALAQKQGKSFDVNGELGKQGKLIPELLNRLNALPFYETTGPKSLGREWVETVFLPELEKREYNEPDILRTVYEHIAIQIAKCVSGTGKLLITGGGAFNSFLIERVKVHTDIELVIPDKQIVEFKEALVFAFLGLLRILELPNCLASVTGAKYDHCSGVIFNP